MFNVSSVALSLALVSFANAQEWSTPGDEHVPLVLTLVRFALERPKPESPSKIYVVAGLGNSGAAYQNTRHNSGRLVVREMARNAVGNEDLFVHTYLMNQGQGVDTNRSDFMATSDMRISQMSRRTYREQTHLRFDDDSRVVEEMVYRSEPILFRTDRGEIFLERDGAAWILYLLPFHDINESGVFVASVVNFLNQHRQLVKAENLYIALDDMDIEFGKFKVSGSSSKGHGGIKSLTTFLPESVSGFQRLRFGIGRPASDSSVIKHVLGSWNDDETSRLDELIKSSAKSLADRIRETERLRIKRLNVEHSQSVLTVPGVCEALTRKAF